MTTDQVETNLPRFIVAARISAPKAHDRTGALLRVFGREPAELECLIVAPPGFAPLVLDEVKVQSIPWRPGLKLAIAPVLEILLAALPRQSPATPITGDKGKLALRLAAFNREIARVAAFLEAEGIQPHAIASQCVHRIIAAMAASSGVQAFALPFDVAAGAMIGAFGDPREAMRVAASLPVFEADSAGALADLADAEAKATAKRASDLAEKQRKAAEYDRTPQRVKVADLDALLLTRDTGKRPAGEITHDGVSVRLVAREFFPWKIPEGALLEAGGVWKVARDDDEVFIAPANRRPARPTDDLLRAFVAVRREVGVDTSPITDPIDARHPEFAERICTLDAYLTLFADAPSALLPIVAANIGCRILRLAPDLVAAQIISRTPARVRHHRHVSPRNMSEILLDEEILEGPSVESVLAALAPVVNGVLHSTICGPDEGFTSHAAVTNNGARVVTGAATQIDLASKVKAKAQATRDGIADPELDAAP